jgi:hypothetical protein
MNKLLGLSLILVFLGCGCFFPFLSGKGSLVPSIVDKDVSVEVLNAPALQKAKKIYFEPFLAGTDAEAGDALDRAALMIIKGFSDDLKRGRFILVSGEDAASADVVIKGHIEELKVRGHWNKIVSMKIRADVYSIEQNEVLALIYARREFKDNRKNYDQAAYDMGYALAERLLE